MQPEYKQEKPWVPHPCAFLRKGGIPRTWLYWGFGDGAERNQIKIIRPQCAVPFPLCVLPRHEISAHRANTLFPLREALH